MVQTPSEIVDYELNSLIDELENIHCGRSLDLYWSYHLHVPFTDDYDIMVDHSKSQIFRTSGQLQVMTGFDSIGRPTPIVSQTDGSLNR